MSRREIGREAENIALKKLKANGYRIITTNFTCKIGEIDIIAEDKKYLIFVEVRSKKNSKYGFPQETVNKKKQNKIKKVALYYLQINDMIDKNCRFDVVAIIFNPVLKVEIIKNAF
jgi:putative endonuclease